MRARNVTQGVSIFVTKGFFRVASCVKVRWNDEVTGLTADRARTEVMLSSALIVSGTPRPNAFQTEDMLAAVQNAKLTSRCKNFFKADLTLCIIFTIIRACIHISFVFHLVGKLAPSSVFAAIRLIEHADLFLRS